MKIKICFGEKTVLANFDEIYEKTITMNDWRRASQRYVILRFI